jgi:Cdc6-like AAA superfamily ATPase
MSLRFNPFQPNKIVAPGMFVGRVNELDQIEKNLFQAKHGNPQNFLIVGERGIGKSSLLLYVDYLARKGDTAGSDIIFNFATVSVDLGSCTSELDIVRAVARGIKRALDEQQVALEATKSILEFLSNWEILGVRYHKSESDIDPEDACDELVQKIAAFCNTLQGELDGILILLDEADQPPSAANLGKFCKYFTERLTKRQCNRVALGLAGLPTILARLRESHESSPRLFEILSLEPLEVSERREVVKRGIEQANVKNLETTFISNDALDSIAELSEGYPHFVQQFAYSAFDVDTDKNVTIEDVLSGAYRENGAISQLGRKYFDEMYFGKISSDDYRLVLNTMATHADNWVSRKQIIEHSKLKDSTVNNALAALKSRNIILTDEARKKQGFYRLPTKSFAVWINAVKSVYESDPKAQGNLQAAFDIN